MTTMTNRDTNIPVVNVPLAWAWALPLIVPLQLAFGMLTLAYRIVSGTMERIWTS